MRLQKFMAHAGVASRRKSEEIIAAGRVKVNGELVREQGYLVEPGDIVTVDGKRIRMERENVILMLNKPRDVLSTTSDEKGRKTVLDFVEDSEHRLYPVGRLDRNTTGLILLTNNGEIAHKLLHPSFEIEKTYRATVDGVVTKEELRQLNTGIELEDGMTLPAKFRIIEVRNNKTRLSCTIREGRNRQIRRMFEAIDHPVLSLQRIQVGELKLGRLPMGKTRKLNNQELKWLQSIR